MHDVSRLLSRHRNSYRPQTAKARPCCTWLDAANVPKDQRTPRISCLSGSRPTPKEATAKSCPCCAWLDAVNVPKPKSTLHCIQAAEGLNM
jgi:hypothetical protein